MWLFVIQRNPSTIHCRPIWKVLTHATKKKSRFHCLCSLFHFNHFLMINARHHSASKLRNFWLKKNVDDAWNWWHFLLYVREENLPESCSFTALFVAVDVDRRLWHRCASLQHWIRSSCWTKRVFFLWSVFLFTDDSKGFHSFWKNKHAKMDLFSRDIECCRYCNLSTINLIRLSGLQSHYFSNETKTLIVFGGFDLLFTTAGKKM